MLRNNLFTDNQQGGICAFYALNLFVEHSKINHFKGTGIDTYRSYLHVRNCEIAYSTKPSGSYIHAGLRSIDSRVYVANTIIHHLNSNGIYFADDGPWSGTELRSYNNTIAHNAVGVRLFMPDMAEFTNCIFASNQLTFDPRGVRAGGIGPTFIRRVEMRNCLTTSIEYDWRLTLISGGNQKNTDPLFINDSLGNFRLFGHSPAVNAGTINTQSLNLGGIDFNGNPRINDGRIDIGAIEHQKFFSTPNAEVFKSIEVVPNPFSRRVFLNYSGDKSDAISWTLSDGLGREIVAGELGLRANEKAELDLPLLDPGVYFLKVSNSAKEEHTFRLLKEI